MNIIDNFFVVWHGEKWQEAVRGIYIYGVYTTMESSCVLDCKLQDLWHIAGASSQSQCIDCGDYFTYILAVRVDNDWPRHIEWSHVVLDSLKLIVEAGSVVSWCGGETCGFVIEALNPEEPNRSDEVYAGYSVQTGFLCHSPGLDDEIEFLDDPSMMELYRLLGQYKSWDS